MTEHIERARTLNRQACDDVDHGRLDAAKVPLNKAIRLVPDLAAPYTNLGVLHCWEGELEEAAVLHLKARRLDPNLSAPHTNLGSVGDIDTSELQTSPSGVPVGVPAVWCEFVN
jgi:Flp pilus assembly protein TadD